MSPRYVGPYEIIERIRNVAYRLALPSDFENVHLVFHVSMLRKYLHDPSHVIQPQAVQLDETLSYEEILVAILDKQVKKLRSKEIPSLKVLWRNHSYKEATWEVEDEVRSRYPQLFE